MTQPQANQQDRPLHEVHKCRGRYMEPDRPWTDSGGGCSQDCPIRHECWEETKAKKQQEEAEQ